VRVDVYPFPFAAEAACSPHNRADDVSHLFFPAEGETRSEFEVREGAAVAICRPCPVRSQCRAARGVRWGIWGGERRTEKKGSCKIAHRGVRV
jgi:WhiB family redox-sensing transcriptional regulator